MIFRYLFLLALGFFVPSCGVKGKPLPPETPREIGIGKPQYLGVDEEMKLSTPPPAEEEKKQEEEK